MLLILIIVLILALGITLHWALVYPCALSFHEQNQLFRYSWSYLQERLAQPGGLCAWMSEFLTQFYYYPTVGALIIAALLLGIYGCTFRYLHSLQPLTPNHDNKAPKTALTRRSAILSAILPCALLCLMGNEQVMLCYVVALLLTLLAGVCSMRLSLGALIPIQIILYYIAGPVAYLFAAMRFRSCRHFLALAITVVACLLLSYAFLTPHYPWAVWMHGLYYFRAVRFDLTAPAALLLLPILVPVLALGQLHIPSLFRWSMPAAVTASLLLALATCLGVRYCYDTDKYAQLRQDYLIRRGRWQTLLDEARLHQPHTAMSCTAVNLALAMTNQLPTHRQQYYQCGMEGLLLSQQRDNIQTLPTMEAFYQLGLINLTQWYAFEAQQSIPNQNHSARLTQRLAECCLITGRYEVASKYIDLLKQTQFYSHWATQAEMLLWNDALLNRHTEYGRLRRWMPPVADDCIFPHPDIDIIIGRLYARNHDNLLALQYYLTTTEYKKDDHGPKSFDNGQNN